MPIFQGNSIFSRKVVLLFRRRKDLASRTETLGDFPRAKRLKNPFWDRGSQGCRPISVNRYLGGSHWIDSLYSDVPLDKVRYA